MPVLAPTQAARMVDTHGRPYFLWDDEMTLESFQAKLAHADPEVRAYFIGKLMRQAKPDDVFSFVTLGDIDAHWPALVRYLGHTRDFWCWLLERWREVRDGADSVLVDLVADPVPIAVAPQAIRLGGATIWVDTAHQLLVNKLCALLSRSELRDLFRFLTELGKPKL